MLGGKRKDEDVHDDESEISELPRTEGADAVAFSSAVDAGCYVPRHKEPPRYIRVHSHHKKTKEFNHSFLAQELVGTQPLTKDGQGNMRLDGEAGEVRDADLGDRKRRYPESGGPLWAAEFSHDGKYLATGGKDRVVRIWAVIATPEDRKSYEAYEEEQQQNCDGKGPARLSAPVFHPKPYREFIGHSSDVLDLSWSKNGFLLSSSMDKTVRLWHLSRPECLCTFTHKDFVTSIAFHPRDDRFFLAGSLDATLRLWSIPDKAVAYSSQLKELVTAVAFTPDGKVAIAGGLSGLCSFYETDGLKFQSQIHVRSTRGKNSRGSKITGISTMFYPPLQEGQDPSTEADGRSIKVLIASNDSRIRIYRLEDKTLELKLKGHENSSNQIRAKFSDDGSYIICGSEDRRAYIWSSDLASAESVVNTKDKDDKRPYEYFEAHAEAVTAAVFAPTATRQLLQASEDPLYTLCNPPAVTLLSKEETQSVHSKDSDSKITAAVKKPDQSPAFLTRSQHTDGNVIVTTDHAGVIKVFRQDCAFSKRRQAHENWETGSAFSKKLGQTAGLLGRSNGNTARASVSSSRDLYARHDSAVNLQQGRNDAQPNQVVDSEQIHKWRDGVEGNAPAAAVNGHRNEAQNGAIATPTFSTRSESPNPSMAEASIKSPKIRGQQPLSPTPSVSGRDRSVSSQNERRMPPTPSFSLRSINDDEGNKDEGVPPGDQTDLELDPAGASYSFWNLNRWRNISGANNRSVSSATVKPGNQHGHTLRHFRSISEVSRLPSPPPENGEEQPQATTPRQRQSLSPQDGAHGLGLTTTVTTDNHLAPPQSAGLLSRFRTASSGFSRLTAESATTSGESSGGEGPAVDVQKCTKCQGRDFKTKKVGGNERLLCSKCGRMVEE